MRPMTFAISALLMSLAAPLSAADRIDREAAVEALHKAITFYREHVSVEGGSVYVVSADLSRREGEKKVGPREAWIEPPATPAVGMAYLRGWQLTRDAQLKDALVEVCIGLIRGQLESGGWANNIEFDRARREKYAYRVDRHQEVGKRFNRTTFDDEKSQAALMCLMLADKEFGFANEAVHEAAEYALEAFSKAQYPNGAWPQQYSEFPNASEFPVRKARFPKSWSREYEPIKYTGFYTLNDNTICDLIEMMLTAHAIYGDDRWLDAAKRGGDFLLLAQLPEPQPGWAQQYNLDMEPEWARKFEPPAITGSESQKVVSTLLTLFEETGERKYIEPLPRTIAYYESLALDDGRMARFYEIGSDRPLYFTTDYELVYTDDDLPTHYGFKGANKWDRLAERYERAKVKTSARPRKVEQEKPVRMKDSLAKRAADVVAALDSRGAWVEEGTMRHYPEVKRVIVTRTYMRNLATLCEFVSARD